MRLRHPDGQLVHLGYCTNVHPAEDLAGIVAQLDTYAVPVRQHLDADLLGLGLWLAAPVAAALADAPAARRRLRRELDARGLEVVTLNGVPYRSLQQPDVNHAVHQPDWSSRRRLEYTLNLARILADLLPDDAACGSVSTVPPTAPGAPPAVARLLDELAEGLTEVAWRTGRLIRVGFEPAPGHPVETTEHAVAALRRADPDRIGICLDLAHLAHAWEHPGEALARLDRAGLPVVKVQVSAALEVDDPVAAADALRPYATRPSAEPGSLYQTRSECGAVADDLEAALTAGMPGRWRVHCHVPMHAVPAPPLATTVPVVWEALDALVGGPVALCDHFDVRVYTWGASPDHPRDPDEFSAAIAAELKLTHGELLARGLAPAAKQDGRAWR